MKTDKNIPMYIIGGLVIAGFFWLLWRLSTNGVPEQNNSLLNTAMGVLLASFSTVVGYWFGSSKGSSDKNDIIKGKQ